MTTYKTGNPVGSADPRDLYDNAQVIDDYANSAGDTTSDRLGVSRRTLAGMENEYAADKTTRDTTFDADQADRVQRFNALLAASGYVFLADYAAGIEVTEYNEVIRDTAGNLWRAAAGTDLPYTTTGAGMPEGGAFVAAGDAVLRNDLAAGVAIGQGALLVRGSVIYVDTIADLQALPVGELVDGQKISIKQGSDVYWSESKGGFVYRDEALGMANTQDFVVYLNKSSTPRKCFVRTPAGGDGIIFSVVSENFNREMFVTEYEYGNDPLGFLRLQVIRIGESEGLTENKYGVVPEDLSGAWNTSLSSVYWATTPGDTFKCAPVIANSIYLSIYSDDRGGIHSVVVVDANHNIVATKMVSTWAPEGEGGVKTVKIAEGLPRGEYRVSGEFLGDDPHNPPRDGAGASRGWLRTFATQTVTGHDESGMAIISDTPQVIMRSSVLEFAITAMPAGSSLPGKWVPYHGGSGDCMTNIQPRFTILGDWQGLAGLGSSSFSGGADYPVECKGLVIDQSYDAQHTDDPGNTLWVGQITYSLSSDGLTVSHDMRFTANTQFGSVYLFMFPVDSDAAPEMRTSGVSAFEYTSTKSGSSVSGFGARKSLMFYGGEVSLGRYLASAATTHAHDAAINFGVGEPVDYGATALLTDRTDGVSKYYSRASPASGVASAGDRWFSSASYAAGVLTFPVTPKTRG